MKKVIILIVALSAVFMSCSKDEKWAPRDIDYVYFEDNSLTLRVGETKQITLHSKPNTWNPMRPIFEVEEGKDQIISLTTPIDDKGRAINHARLVKGEEVGEVIVFGVIQKSSKEEIYAEIRIRVIE